ncbi:DUF1801 domain-containing protein [Streptomyces xanthochromogenes]|uniref:iron chaperone n=1 Tax=Streptomyces xanthochromogenes TaxID=67384 RepID=UPI0034215DE3
MTADVQSYIDEIPPRHRPLFDRVHRLILNAFPRAGISLSYGMPTYQVGERRLHVAAWQHGISVYGWDKGRAAQFISRHPHLVSGKGTIRLRSEDAASLTDDELSDLIRGSLDA